MKQYIRAVLLSLLIVPVLFGNLSAAQRGIKVIANLNHQSGKIGTYRALIIGIDTYKDDRIPELKTAVNDARAMASILQEKYGFQTKLILNEKATRRTLAMTLRNMVDTSKTDDSVLIYYAGHGDLDRLYNDGWWIPHDATAGDPTTYFDNVQIQKALRAMKSRHALLISDSCYSGTLFGQARAMPKVITEKYYLNLYNEKSRWGMTSGNKEPVSDQGTGGHSIFAYQLLKTLQQNEKPYLSTQEIYTKIAPIVGNNSEQTPICRPIRNTGDQGGEFIFVASNAAEIEKPSPGQEKTTLSVEANLAGAKIYVDGQYLGHTPLIDRSIAPGKHRLLVEKDGYHPYQKQIQVESGRSKSYYVDLSHAGPKERSLIVDTEPTAEPRPEHSPKPTDEDEENPFAGNDPMTKNLMEIWDNRENQRADDQLNVKTP